MPMTIATSANPISMSQAITDLIESIALEETALSHILHAESEKLHKAINMGEVTLEEIMNVNDTVMSMVSTINELEHTLRDKLEFISNNRVKARAPEAPAEMCMCPPPAASAAAGGQPSKRKRAGRVTPAGLFVWRGSFAACPAGAFLLAWALFSRNRPPFQKHAA